MNLWEVIVVFVTVRCNSCRDLRIKTSQFTNDEICDVGQRELKGCSKLVDSRGRGRLGCLARCNEQDSCIGVSLTSIGECFLHELCPAVESRCVVRDENHDYWSRYCVRGRWNQSTRSCRCVDGSSGERCDQFPPTCQGLIHAGYGQGRYRVYIKLRGLKLVRVTCYIIPPTFHSIVLVRNQGGVSFNRTWSEYSNGFYQDDKNFWTGLSTWELMTHNQYQVVTFSLIFINASKVYRTYYGFLVGSEAVGYQFEYEKSKATKTGGLKLGNCLRSNFLTPFSTWDNDHDGDMNENCASRARSGWWYSGCDGRCNVLGWGVGDDWENAPRHQRFHVRGVDMALPAPVVDIFEISITE